MTTLATNKFFSVKEFQAYLALNSIEWSEVWIRTQVRFGRIRSEKVFSSRLIPREEAERIVREKKDKQ